MSRCVGDRFGCPTSEWECQLSKLDEYQDRLPYACETELLQYLRLHPASWHALDPKQMELLVAEVFRANYRPSEVLHVGRPDDGGVDVIFVDSDRGKWLVQVKSHAYSSASEGVGTIRNLLGAILLEGALRGVVVPNADHFTYRACEAAGRAQEKGYTIRLIDKGKLNRMLDPLLPCGCWRQFVRRRRPDWLRRFGAEWPNPDQLTLNGCWLGTRHAPFLG